MAGIFRCPGALSESNSILNGKLFSLQYYPTADTQTNLEKVMQNPGFN